MIAAGGTPEILKTVVNGNDIFTFLFASSRDRDFNYSKNIDKHDGFILIFQTFSRKTFEDIELLNEDILYWRKSKQPYKVILVGINSEDKTREVGYDEGNSLAVKLDMEYFESDPIGEKESARKIVNDLIKETLYFKYPNKFMKENTSMMYKRTNDNSFCNIL